MNHFLTLIFLMVAMTFISTSFDDAHAKQSKTALFAGGCFWCMQPSYDNTAGVISTSVGYAGGTKETATYDQVSTGKTDHTEVIQITYNPAKVTYEKLLETYWENIDPTDGEGQFADKGSQYIPAIYYADDAQRLAAEASKKAIATKFAPKPILVKLLPITTFYAAEDYHQRYYEKNSAHYNAYKQGSGRAGYLKETWGKK
jgi:methionine-S-sulfoxide reductase